MWTAGAKENTEVLDDMEASEDMLIMVDEMQIAQLTKRLQTETNPDAIEKLMKNIYDTEEVVLSILNQRVSRYEEKLPALKNDLQIAIGARNGAVDTDNLKEKIKRVNLKMGETMKKMDALKKDRTERESEMAEKEGEIVKEAETREEKKPKVREEKSEVKEEVKEFGSMRFSITTKTTETEIKMNMNPVEKENLVHNPEIEPVEAGEIDSTPNEQPPSQRFAKILPSDEKKAKVQTPVCVAVEDVSPDGADQENLTVGLNVVTVRENPPPKTEPMCGCC